MGKVSPTSIKYLVYAKFQCEGVVEKPDIIGAVFGQTEGLLGEDLELRELQKEGKIGRIEVRVDNKEGKSEGEIEIPTALDKAETTIIGAALETIDRIGPCDAKITIQSIEDVRSSKREYVIERAKKLLHEINKGVPESREIEDAVKKESRMSLLQEYGRDRLPAGPELDKEIILVEGRADVLNLLKYGVKNVIGMNGTSIPRSIRELVKNAQPTLFVDGDRGGLLITKNLGDDIDFVARDPDGKEVEELTGKEILSCLRAKKPNRKKSGYERTRRTKTHKIESEPDKEKKPAKELIEADKEKLRKILQKLPAKKACSVDENLEAGRSVSVFELPRILKKYNVFTLVITGTVTNTLLKQAKLAGCQYILAKNYAVKDSQGINLLS